MYHASFDSEMLYGMMVIVGDDCCSDRSVVANIAESDVVATDTVGFVVFAIILSSVVVISAAVLAG